MGAKIPGMATATYTECRICSQKSVEPSKPIRHERPIEICYRLPLLRRNMPD